MELACIMCEAKATTLRAGGLLIERTTHHATVLMYTPLSLQDVYHWETATAGDYAPLRQRWRQTIMTNAKVSPPCSADLWFRRGHFCDASQIGNNFDTYTHTCAVASERNSQHLQKSSF